MRWLPALKKNVAFLVQKKTAQKSLGFPKRDFRFRRQTANLGNSGGGCPCRYGEFWGAFG